MNKYDAFLHIGKPSSEALGLRPISMVYFKDISISQPIHYPISPDEDVSWSRLAERCEAALASDTLMVLDIEHWPIGDQRFIDVAQWVREHYPAMRFGFFWTRGHDERLRPYVDFVTIALYPHWPTVGPWIVNATDLLSRDYGKPVLVFLRPEYTKRAGTDLDSTSISPCYWQVCRELTAQYPIEGVIYWGGHKQEWPSEGISL